MDWIAFELAQRLVGQSGSFPGLEVSVGGIEIEASGHAVTLALAGVGFTTEVNGEAIAVPCAVRLVPGDRLLVRTGSRGAWCYAAPAGRIDGTCVMGSMSTHVRYRLGPGGGRPLQGGDVITIEEARPADPVQCSFPHLDSRAPIRVVLGPQHRVFALEEVERFLGATFTLSVRCDRMAYVLDGRPVRPERSYDIVTDATVLGSMQIAGDGKPYVLMADCPSTGGYPKIATIIRADIGRFAQLRPGDSVTFEQVTVGQAAAELARIKRALDRLESGRSDGSIDLDALRAGINHTGIINAHTPET